MQTSDTLTVQQPATLPPLPVLADARDRLDARRHAAKLYTLRGGAWVPDPDQAALSALVLTDAD